MKTTPIITAARVAIVATLRQLGDAIAAQWVAQADTAQMLCGNLLDAAQTAGETARTLRERPRGGDRADEVQRASDLERLRVAATFLAAAVRTANQRDDAADANRLAREALMWLEAGLPAAVAGADWADEIADDIVGRGHEPTGAFPGPAFDALAHLSTCGDTDDQDQRAREIGEATAACVARWDERVRMAAAGKRRGTGG